MLTGRIPFRFLPFLWAACLLLISSSALLALPQEEEEEIELPNIKELSNEVTDEYKNKRDRNVERIVEIFNIFDRSFKDVPDKDQKEIIKCLKKAFDIKPAPENKDFLRSAAACMSSMDKLGLDALQYALKSKILKPKDKSNEAEVRDCLSVTATLVEAMGQTKNTGAIKPLSKLLWNDEADVIRAACNGLACFNELSLKERKTIVEELVKVYAYLQAQSAANPKRPDLREKLLAVEVAFNQALQKMTLQSFDNAPDWQNWYNNNKNKREW